MASPSFPDEMAVKHECEDADRDQHERPTYPPLDGAACRAHEAVDVREETTAVDESLAGADSQTGLVFATSM